MAALAVKGSASKRDLRDQDEGRESTKDVPLFATQLVAENLVNVHRLRLPLHKFERYFSSVIGHPPETMQFQSKSNQTLWRKP